MNLPEWREAPLGRLHDRAAFDCGDIDLNDYLRRYARQNHDSGGAKCFVAAPVGDPARVLGFYTLSPASIEYARTPAFAKKGLGRYDVPCFNSGALRSIVRHRVGASAAPCSSTPRNDAFVRQWRLGASRC